MGSRVDGLFLTIAVGRDGHPELSRIIGADDQRVGLLEATGPHDKREPVDVLSDLRQRSRLPVQ